MAFVGACKSPASSGAPSPPAAPSSSGVHEHDHELHLPPVGPSVTVRFDGKAQDVTLASLPREPGSDVVPLVAVWKAAWPAQDPSPLHFDLVGSDGFRPMSRPKCTHLLGGDEVAHLRLNVVTHDVTVDGLDLPGCYRVKAVIGIEATR
jgi:hypothetical protein